MPEADQGLHDRMVVVDPGFHAGLRKGEEAGAGEGCWEGGKWNFRWVGKDWLFSSATAAPSERNPEPCASESCMRSLIVQNQRLHGECLVENAGIAVP